MIVCKYFNICVNHKHHTDLQYLSSYSVFLSSVEGFGMENYIGTVARFRTGNIAFATKLHPRNGEDRPTDTQSRWMRCSAHSRRHNRLLKYTPGG